MGIVDRGASGADWRRRAPAYLTTLNLSLAGVGSVLAAASVARTLNLCLPRFNRLYFFGDVQGLRFLTDFFSPLALSLRLGPQSATS